MIIELNKVLSYTVEKAKVTALLMFLIMFVFIFTAKGEGFYINVGAFLIKENADRYAAELEKAGIKVFTEEVLLDGNVYTRVVIDAEYKSFEDARRAVEELENSRIITRNISGGLWLRSGSPGKTRDGEEAATHDKSGPTFIKPEEYESRERVVDTGEKDGLRIMMVGEAGVMEIVEKPDSAPLDVVQVVPGHNNLTGTRGPLLAFLNDRVYIPSITGGIEVLENGVPIDGTVTILPSSSGFAILSYVPDREFKNDSDISMTIKRGLKGAGGKPLSNDVTFRVKSGLTADKGFAGNLGFEKGMRGVVMQGDGSVMKAPDGFEAPEGKHFAALSTGTVFTRRPAMMDTTSVLTCGPIEGILREISFKYNFASAEFNNYIGSTFDDSVLLIITGVDSNRVYMVTSVNIAGYQKDSLPYNFFSGFPDIGKTNGITGWKNFEAKDLNIKGPVTLTFIITDVGDSRLVSLFFIDDIRVKTVDSAIR